MRRKRKGHEIAGALAFQTKLNIPGPDTEVIRLRPGLEIMVHPDEAKYLQLSTTSASNPVHKMVDNSYNLF